ncbi:MAG: 50S ribosomal protein L13 [Clostridiales bacterium]
MQTTYMAKPSEVEKKWYVLDAAGKPIGRVATEAARLLRGKHKPTFTPHIDTGDNIIVINAEKAILTGNKLDQKFYYHHSGFPGGIKSISYRKLMETKPELALELAIKGMVPHNRLGRQIMKKLRIYKGADHSQQAQMPEAWTF